MTHTWSAGGDNGGGGDPLAARHAIPLADADGGAADAWRRAARIVAWVGLVMGTLTFTAIVLNQLDVRTSGISIYLTAAFSAASWADKALAILQMAGVGLAGLMVFGSVGVLARRRWGPSALIVYGAAAPVVMIGYVVAFAFSRPFGSIAGRNAWFMIQYALGNLSNLAFPAVVFFVMRAARPHLVNPAAGGAAFEPLPRPT